MYALNYEGLKKKETYSEIIDYLVNKQETINMPNRVAKQVRNSPQLSSLLDGNGEGLLEMEEQQKRATEEIGKEHRIQENANEDGGPTERRAFQPRPQGSAPTTAKGEPQVFDMSVGDFKDDLEEAIEFFNEKD